MDLTILKSIRKERKLSQMELASKVGITRSYLSTVENGRGNPSHGLVVRIVGELGHGLQLTRNV